MTRTPSLASLLAAGAAAALAVPGTTGYAAEVKTLDDINIEGEIRLPRVLFITSRETVRPLDFLGLCLPPAEGEAPPVGPVPVVGTPATAVPGSAGADAAAAATRTDADPSTTAPSDTSEEENR